MARIGLWGGSFNPPTIAHKALADFAAATLQLDDLWWVVCPQNVDKDPKTLAPFNHRVAMVEQVLRDRPHMRASRMEEGQKSTETIHTVRAARAMHPDDHLFFLMGTDNWKTFHMWGADYADILKYVSIVVFRRPGYDDGLDHFPASTQFAATRAADPQKLPPHGGWIVLENPQYDMAATMARQALAAGRAADAAGILHPDTMAYIKREGLY